MNESIASATELSRVFVEGVNPASEESDSATATADSTVTLVNNVAIVDRDSAFVV